MPTEACARRVPHVTEKGYSTPATTFARGLISLPQTTRQLEKFPELPQNIDELLPRISLSNKTARRESLVSYILLESVR